MRVVSINKSVWWLGAGLAGLLLAASCTAQPVRAPAAVRWAADSATVQVAAGPQYGRGGMWRFFWGRHYRRLWATPVTAPVLRLAPAGLCPVQAGGSYQSNSLRLQAADGRQFVLRSVDKDGARALPAGWKRRLLGGLMSDQTSSGQPYGAYVAAALAEAAGVYHANPRLVYLPDDPDLGAFRPRFANALYLLEERAQADHGADSFGQAPEMLNSARMLGQLRQRFANQAEARAYLRARLLDIWLGDWSRREDQWRWAAFPQPGGGTRYRPIPRDRDQAFFLFDDGVFTEVISWFRPRFQSFHATIKLRQVDHLTVTARALDQTLLAYLSAEDFRQEADSLQRRLGDAALRRALQAGPPETRALATAALLPKLQSRRARLPAVAQQYHAVLARESWIIGTDRPERFVLSAAGPGRLRVQVLARRPTGPDSLVAEQTFNRHLTRSVSLFGLGGDDAFELRGRLRPGFAVGLYGGADRNTLVAPAGAAGRDLTWYGSGEALPPAFPAAPDPDPVRSANAAGWLKNYRLAD